MTETELLLLRDSVKEGRDFFLISNEFLANMIYNSLSFENGLGSLEDVNKILSGEIEQCDSYYVSLVINLKNAFLFVVDLAKNKQDLTEETLKDIHQLLMNDLGIGGLYRNVNISIKGSNHTPPDHVKVYDRMNKYFNNLRDMKPSVECAAYSHLQLAKIHPFLDGNGRCARLIMNYFLLKCGLPPITIPYSLKDRYFDCLESYKIDKDINKFVNFIIEREKEELLK